MNYEFIELESGWLAIECKEVEREINSWESEMRNALNDLIAQAKKQRHNTKDR